MEKMNLTEEQAEWLWFNCSNRTIDEFKTCLMYWGHYIKKTLLDEVKDYYRSLNERLGADVNTELSKLLSKVIRELESHER